MSENIERYLTGERKFDVWVSDTEFQCNRCSHVIPEGFGARTANGTLVCEGCLDLIGNVAVVWRSGRPPMRRLRRLS
jgi:hypothetical protein